MKIIRIIARLNVGGPARHVTWLTQELAAVGHHTMLVTGTVPPGETDMRYLAERCGVHPYVIPEMSRELTPRDIIVVWKLLRLFWRERPDVIHTHTAKAGAVGRTAAFIYRLGRAIPPFRSRPRPIVVHTYHGHVFHSYYGRLKTSVFLAVERTLARVTDRIIVLSDQQLRQINEEFRVGKASQFAIVRLGLDLAAFEGWHSRRQHARQQMGVADSDLVIGIVGRLTEIKNHSLFLKAAGIMLRDATPTASRLRFLVVGEGHLREALEREAAALGLGDRVRFLGMRDDLEMVYPALDIVALTSRNEGTPLSLIEGMANHRPFASTAAGGVVDLLGPLGAPEPGVPQGVAVHAHGVAILESTPGSVAEALHYLAACPSLRTSMGKRGSAFVQSVYSLARLTRDIRCLYEELRAST